SGLHLGKWEKLSIRPEIAVGVAYTADAGTLKAAHPFRQMFGINNIIRHRNRVEDRVFKLSDIAGPIIFLQLFKSRFRKFERVRVPLSHLSGEMFGKQRDVLATLS